MQIDSSFTSDISEVSPTTAPEGNGAPPRPSPKAKEKRRKAQQPRQPQSCSKCRERKVKCDKTKPCSACCARGHPNECVFILDEGTAFGPIQQARELIRLRKENHRLKEKLLNAKINIDLDSDDGAPSSAHTSSMPHGAQRRFGMDEPGDSLYFGTPSLASVIAELSQTSHTSERVVPLSFNAPHVALLTDAPNTYPFPTVWTHDTWVSGLYDCLQPWNEVSSLLQSYCHGPDTISRPRLATGITKADMDRFIGDFEHSATAYPDLLALCFAILATQLQRQIYDQEPQQQLQLDVASLKTRANMYMAASAQACRQSSFLSQPTLLSLQALTLQVVYCANDDRPLDAWTQFGVVIRMAQAMGLHRDPKLLNPLPSLRESVLRKKLWWYLLGLDQQYSKALGRPMGISAMGDCPMPEPLTTDVSMLRISACMDQLTVLGRQIMGTTPLTTNRIVYYIDKLNTLSDNLPDEIVFTDSWITEPADVPDQYVREQSAVFHSCAQSYLALLHRQQIVQTPHVTNVSSGASTSSQAQVAEEGLSKNAETSNARARAAMIKASIAVVNVFEYLAAHHHNVLTGWTVRHQTLTACTTLLLDLQQRSSVQPQSHLERAIDIFNGLSVIQQSTLAQNAVQRLTEGLAQALTNESARRGVQSQFSSFALPSAAASGSRRDSTISSVPTMTPHDRSFITGSEVKSPLSVDTAMGNATPVHRTPQSAMSYPPQPMISPLQQRRSSLTQPSYRPLHASDLMVRTSTSTSDPAHLAIYSSPSTPVNPHFAFQRPQVQHTPQAMPQHKINTVGPSVMHESAHDPHSAAQFQHAYGMYGAHIGQSPMHQQMAPQEMSHMMLQTPVTTLAHAVSQTTPQVLMQTISHAIPHAMASAPAQSMHQVMPQHAPERNSQSAPGHQDHASEAHRISQQQQQQQQQEQAPAPGFHSFYVSSMSDTREQHPPQPQPAPPAQQPQMASFQSHGGASPWSSQG